MGLHDRLVPHVARGNVAHRRPTVMLAMSDTGVYLTETVSIAAAARRGRTEATLRAMRGGLGVAFAVARRRRVAIHE